MKKIFSIMAIALVSTLLLAGCTKSLEHIEGNLEDLMSKIYAGIEENKLPMMLTNQELTEENIEYYIGTKDLKWKEAIASESMTGSIPHSVVLIRMSEDATAKDIEDAKTKIKDNVKPNKWICVEAQNVIVENKGDLIVLIMTNELAETLQTNFNKLK